MKAETGKGPRFFCGKTKKRNIAFHKHNTLNRSYEESETIGIFNLPECLLHTLCAGGQKAMTFDEMVSWKRITEQAISHDGKWVACKMEPWRGDASILVYNAKGEMTASFRPAGHAEFSASSRYLLVTKKPELETVEALKLKKVKDEEMPADELVIFNLPDKKESIDSLKSYKLSETADWIAYKRSSKSDSVLHVRSLDGAKEVLLADVKEFGFAKKGNILYYTTDSTLSTFTPDKGSSLIFEGKGVIKK